jgi:predicted MPP superfamily phosphohydrolase
VRAEPPDRRRTFGRRLVSAFHARFAARAPFTDPEGRKGFWEPFTRAPPHRVTRYTLPLDGVGAAPWTAALLSDLHVGAHGGDCQRYAKIVAETNALGPDLVLLLGDYMNTMPGFSGRVPPETVAAILGELRAPHGVHAVLGNHDWKYGAQAVRAALRGVGIGVIDNTVVPLARGRDRLTLVGLEDEVHGRPNLALLDDIADGAPRLVVTHNPGLFLDIPEGCVMIAGHLHGGQIRFPGLPALVVPTGRAPRRWANGHFRERGGQLVVSAGLGVSGLPWRFGIAPEIVLLALVGAERHTP